MGLNGDGVMIGNGGMMVMMVVMVMMGVDGGDDNKMNYNGGVNT